MADSFNTSWHDLLSLLQTATSSSNTTTQATTISGLLDDDSDYLPNERLGQGLYLMMLALSGISLNILIFFFVLASKFPAENGFMLHACILDAFKVSMKRFQCILLNSGESWIRLNMAIFTANRLLALNIVIASFKEV